MARKLSRRELATYIAGELVRGTSQQVLVNQLAGYLIETRRTKELSLIIRDVEFHLVDQGMVVAKVTSAFEFQGATLKSIETMIRQATGAKTIDIQQVVDSTVLGGIKIDIPGSQLDATITHRLSTLRTSFKKA